MGGRYAKERVDLPALTGGRRRSSALPSTRFTLGGARRAYGFA